MGWEADWRVLSGYVEKRFDLHRVNELRRQRGTLADVQTNFAFAWKRAFRFVLGDPKRVSALRPRRGGVRGCIGHAEGRRGKLDHLGAIAPRSWSSGVVRMTFDRSRRRRTRPDEDSGGPGSLGTPGEALEADKNDAVDGRRDDVNRISTIVRGAPRPHCERKDKAPSPTSGKLM